MEQDINIKKAWVEASVAEFVRCLPGMVILISKQEAEDVGLMLERVLNDTWDHAQAPVLKALIKEFVI